MTKELRKDIKFYFSMICAMGLFVMGALLPPLGIIHNSVLMAGGMICAIAGGCIGIDLTELVHQFRLMKDGKCLEREDLTKPSELD